MLNRYLLSYSNFNKGCWQSVLLTLIESMATGICFFLSIYFVSYLQLSIAISGFLISAYGVGTICGGIMGGKLSDYFSSKKISVLNLLLQSFSFYLLSIFNRVEFLMMIMFMIGVFTYGFMTANNIWLMNQCRHNPEIRLKGININRVASNLGMGLAGMIIGLFEANHFTILFNLSSITLLFAALYFQFFVSDAHSSIENYKTEQFVEDKKIISVMPIRVLGTLLSCVFFGSVIISQLSTTYPVFINHTFSSLGIKAVSILFILDTVLIVLFQVPLVNELKRFNKILLIGMGIFLMGIGMFILIFTSSFKMAIVSCIIWTLGEMIFIGMIQFVYYESTTLKNKGQSMGIFQAISAAGKVLGPIVGGYVYCFKSSSFLWLIGLIIGIFCLCLCIQFRRYDTFKC